MILPTIRISVNFGSSPRLGFFQLVLLYGIRRLSESYVSKRLFKTVREARKKRDKDLELLRSEEIFTCHSRTKEERHCIFQSCSLLSVELGERKFKPGEIDELGRYFSFTQRFENLFDSQSESNSKRMLGFVNDWKGVDFKEHERSIYSVYFCAELSW